MDNASIKKLIAEGDFLKFTLENIDKPFKPFSFERSFLGTTLSGKSDVKTAINAEVIAQGMIVFTPKAEPSDLAPDLLEDKLPRILLSCGIHGNETAPIELCQAFIRDIIQGKVNLKVKVLFIIGNIKAVHAQKRFVAYNLNTLFSRKHGLSYQNASHDFTAENDEKNRACVIEHWVDWFFHQDTQTNSYKPIHLDLHTAIRGSKFQKFAISPYLHGEFPSYTARKFLTECELECLLLAHAPTHAFTYFTSSTFQAISFTLELGQVKPWGENNLEECASFIKNIYGLLEGTSQVLNSLLKLNNTKSTENCLKQSNNQKQSHNKKQSYSQTQESYLVQGDNSLLPSFSMHREIIRTSQDFSFNFSENVDNFTEFPVGYELAKDGDETLFVEKVHEAILFPNAEVAIGERALLTVVPIT